MGADKMGMKHAHQSPGSMSQSAAKPHHQDLKRFLPVNFRFQSMKYHIELLSIIYPKQPVLTIGTMPAQRREDLNLSRNPVGRLKRFK